MKINYKDLDLAVIVNNEIVGKITESGYDFNAESEKELSIKNKKKLAKTVNK